MLDPAGNGSTEPWAAGKTAEHLPPRDVTESVIFVKAQWALEVPCECSLLLESVGGHREGPRGVEGCLNSRPMGGHQPGSHRVQPAKDVVLLRGESGVSDGPGWVFPGCCLPEVPPTIWRSRGLEWSPLGLGCPVPGLRGFSGAHGCCGWWYVRPRFFYSFERSQFFFCCLLLLLLSCFSRVWLCATP